MSALNAVKSYRFLATGVGTFIIYLHDDCAGRIGEVVRMVVGLNGFLTKENSEATTQTDFIGDFRGVHISSMPSSNTVTVVFTSKKKKRLFAKMLTAVGDIYGWVFDKSDPQ